MTTDNTPDTPGPPDQATAPAPRPKGIACPQCGIQLQVVTTRKVSPGVQIRYVECPGCKLTARTEERLVRTFRRQ